MKEKHIDPLAEKLGIEPEKWELIKSILIDDNIPSKQESRPKVIDNRPLQKKLSDFLPKTG